VDGTDNLYELYSVSSSSSGQYQIACSLSENLFISIDFGDTWVYKNVYPELSSVSISSSGQYMMTTGVYDYIYISHDRGDTWSEIAISENWVASSMSSSGKYQTALTSNKIYTSSNYGSTWTQVNTSGPQQSFSSISMSASGRYQVVSCSLNFKIYVSIDFGSTWKNYTTTNKFNKISVSSSGQFIIGGHSTGLYISDAIGDLPSEISSRVSGDYSLSIDLSSEITSRLSGVSSLSSALSSEISSRLSGDSSLSTGLSSEISSRVSGDDSLSSALSSEISSRIRGVTSTNFFYSRLSGIGPGYIYPISDPTTIYLGNNTQGKLVTPSTIIYVPTSLQWEAAETCQWDSLS
jgi:photosystem II stability/assembly factor-like uncharacterized protein